MRLRTIRVIIPVKANQDIWHDDSTCSFVLPCQSLGLNCESIEFVVIIVIV